jgi:broad specificity phosphatase PhoE
MSSATSKIEVWLVRHGEDEDNAEKLLNGHRNRPLTRKGQAQAATTAAAIRREAVLGGGFDHIFCSPLQRAHHTALAIAHALYHPTPLAESPREADDDDEAPRPPPFHQYVDEAFARIAGEGDIAHGAQEPPVPLATFVPDAVRALVQPLDALIERDFGELTGRPRNDIRRVVPEEHLLETPGVTYFLNAPGAESFEACHQRAVEVLSAVEALATSKAPLPLPPQTPTTTAADPAHSHRARFGDEAQPAATQGVASPSGRRPRVLLVCHGDIGKMILAVRRDISWKDALTSGYFGNADVHKL